MLAWILVGGRLTLTPALAALPRPALVVGADGGARHASALGVGLDVWVGDFDSSAGLSLDAPREVHPAAKDQTDGELATRLALERGATELVFVGAFGGRFDHTAALLLGGVRLAGAGVHVTLTSGDEWAWPLRPSVPFRHDFPPGVTLSVVACADLSGLSLSGVRWALSEANVPLGSGWTLSNEAAGGEVRAEVQAGYGLVTALWTGGAGTPHAAAAYPEA